MKLKTGSIFFVTLAILAFVFFSNVDFGQFTIFVLAALVMLAAYLDSGKKFFTSLGFDKKNVSFLKLGVLAPVAGFLILLIYRYILVPSVTKLTGVPIDISLFEPIRGNLDVLLVTLIFVWNH